MRNFSFFKHKKGLEDSGTWGLKEIAILVLCAFGVYIILSVTSTLYAATLSQKDEGSKANLNRLYNNIKLLLENSEPRAYIEDSYFLGENRVLVGFDTYWDETREIIDFRLWDDYNVYKPSLCGTSACLCLYTNDWDPRTAENRNKELLQCRSEAFVGKNIIFFSEGGNINPKTKGTQREDMNENYLIFYGDEWETQQIYIEKEYKKEENKYYIYISKINKQNQNDPATLRKR
ncbi:hypothetical protein HY637_03255 [Candidatus Woesearchaeota archaeon]|nr:hypothetical protein [Candidatus Woesearchaeota archaeon]